MLNLIPHSTRDKYDTSMGCAVTFLLCGEYNILGKMDAESGPGLWPLSAPFAPTVDKGLNQNPLANFELCTGSPFWTLSVPLAFSVEQPPWTRPMLRPQSASETRWPLPHRLPRFSSEAHLIRLSRYGNPALQSQGGQDNAERQIIQGASQPTRPTLSASGA